MAERTYNYTAKNVVRELWMQFLPNFRNKTAHGLYLPSVENLELDGYIAKGVSSAQLLGCEHDESLQQKVLEAAGGAVVVAGDVKAGVSHAEQLNWPRLKFVNLDFDGTYNSHISEMLSVFRVFPAEDEGYLAVTSYAARDMGCLTQGFVNLSKFYSSLDRPSFMTDVGAMLSRWHRSRHDIKSRVSDHHYLSREIGLLWWLGVGMTVVGYQGRQYGRIAQSRLDSLETALSELTKIAEARAQGTDFSLVRHDGLSKIVKRLHVELWPTDLRHILYYSHRKQPMRTWFLRICPIPLTEKVTAQELLVQLWELATRAPLLFIGEDGARTTYE